MSSRSSKCDIARWGDNFIDVFLLSKVKTQDMSFLCHETIRTRVPSRSSSKDFFQYCINGLIFSMINPTREDEIIFSDPTKREALVAIQSIKEIWTWSYWTRIVFCLNLSSNGVHTVKNYYVKFNYVVLIEDHTIWIGVGFYNIQGTRKSTPHVIAETDHVTPHGDERLTHDTRWV